MILANLVNFANLSQFSRFWFILARYVHFGNLVNFIHFGQFGSIMSKFENFCPICWFLHFIVFSLFMADFAEFWLFWSILSIFYCRVLGMISMFPILFNLATLVHFGPFYFCTFLDICQLSQFLPTFYISVNIHTFFQFPKYFCSFESISAFHSLINTDKESILLLNFHVLPLLCNVLGQ